MLHTLQIGLFELAGSPMWVCLHVPFYCQDDINPNWVADRLVDQLVSDDGRDFVSVVVMFEDGSEDFGPMKVNPWKSLDAMEAWVNSTPGVRFL